MSDSEKEIMDKLKEKEKEYSLPPKILESIYDEERLVLYKGRRRDMDEKILRIINQFADEYDYEKLKELLGENDNSKN